MTIDLSGRWTLRRERTGETWPMALPGDVVSALAEAGEIPEPYEGRGEYDCRWVCEEDWTVARTVTVEDPNMDLVVDGLDTVAEVLVNGAEVGRAANAFRTQRFDASGALRAGKNELRIRFRSPVEAGREIHDRLPYPVPWSKNCPIPYGNALRKPDCDFGWDWNVALASSGVWNAVRLELRRAGRIDGVAVEMELVPEGLRATVRVRGGGEEITATLCGVSETAFALDGTATLELMVPDPDLWWPAGMGAQPIHELTVTSGAEREIRRVALRDVRLVSEPDGTGRSFAVTVNGRPVFWRGANWIPSDALPGRMHREATEDLLASAAAMNMTGIRIWGGGRYEPDWFYEACDRLGLLLWQDLMFACSLYPATRDFLEEVAAETREVAERLSHHVALWCGDNELIGALDWYEESRADRDRYLVGYDRLNRTLEEALRSTLPMANWWPSSPSPGPMSFGDAWHQDGQGDMHVWSVWHDGKDFDFYRTLTPRFVSEFGFQSYPSMEVVRRFAEPEDMNIASPVMESHQKNEGGNARIAETMFRYYRFPESFEDFVWLSQVQQGEALRTAVDAWRALRPTCQGAVIWQLNDTWPVCSWSLLDHGGGWKASAHMAKGFFAPVRVVAIPEGERIRLVGLNDTGTPARLRVTAHACAMDGEAEEIATGEAEIGEAAVTLCELDAPSGNRVLVFGWEGDAAGGDVFAPRPWKSYDLPDARPRFEARRDGGSWALDLSVSAMSFYLTAEASCPGRWDRNVVHLGPGRAATLRFTPDGPGTPDFALRDLYSATYGKTP